MFYNGCGNPPGSKVSGIGYTYGSDFDWQVFGGTLSAAKISKVLSSESVQ